MMIFQQSELTTSTKDEVKQLLADTGFSDHEEEVRKWYNGYRFGSMEIYCPWDVLNHVSALQDNPRTLPKNYWGSTSHNSVIYRFISRDDLNVNEKFELLLGGGTLVESITEDLSYDTLFPGEVPLRIPNEELKTIFQKNIVDWFQESVQSSDRSELFEAFWNGDVEKAAEEVSNLLFDTISYHDYLESYYHTFVAGLFAGAGYIVESNYERGKGRPDIVIKDNKKRRALVMEIKHTKKDNELRAKCEEAAAQVIQKKYSWGLEKGYRTVRSYGVAFCEKECLIKKAE